MPEADPPWRKNSMEIGNLKLEILPSILVKTREELIDKVKQLEQNYDRAHLDIADGIFVPNKTIDGFEELEDMETNLLFTVHLMVSKPENHITRWLETSADSFVFHVEATSQHKKVIDEIKEADATAGIALNPKTAHSAIADFVNLVDFVHFMTVEPGFMGSDFLPEVIEKIADFHYYYPDMPIIADGGITPDNIDKLREAGVSKFVVGSHLDLFANHLIT